MPPTVTSPDHRRSPRTRVRRVACLVTAGALLLASCSGSSDSDGSGRARAGSVMPVAATGSFTADPVTCSDISMYPSPGTATASAATQVSFQNVDAAAITDSSVTVSGSQSGDHTGRVVADADGHGASFHPAQPFTAGETVTVTAPGRICGADAAEASFDIIGADIAPLPKPEPAKNEPHEITDDELQHFVSEPDLVPPALEVEAKNPAPDEDAFFLGPKSQSVPGGPMIVDGNGDLVWYHEVPEGDMVADFRTQVYQGEPVLTWWQGVIDKGNGTGKGHIVGTDYEPIATVEAGNGYDADMHEFLLQPDGSAWITIYHEAPGDMIALGGARNGAVLDSIVQQIDIATGNVMFEWHSLDHVATDLSTTDYDTESPKPFDYFHVNSIDPTGAGTILISARNTNAAYLLNRATGDVVWTLGGKDSSFEMGTGTEFVYQHDARFRGDRIVTIFDNETKQTPARLIAIELDVKAKKAKLVWAHTAPGELPAMAQGNLQVLPNGNLVSGWGSSSLKGPTELSTTVTEYDPDGDVLFHARFMGKGINTYRAYRLPWTGTPKTEPAAKVTDDGKAVAVSWNGATQVASWDLVDGSGPGAQVITAQKRDGFETRITVDGDLPAGTVVRALDANGHVIATAPVAS